MRLHIGASRIQLAKSELRLLRTADWIHLGEPESVEETQEQERINAACSSPVLGKYVSFYYSKGTRLSFAEDAFTFAYSEHFLEHLFLDEACELMKECFRVLQPNACLRISVPDADLRTYMPPEPAAYSTGDYRWFHPDKHKTRWSIYSLGYVLEQIGFAVRGLVYCDKFGHYHFDHPQSQSPFYEHSIDQTVVMETSYIDRLRDSLVVDAIKPESVTR